jgi:hypothetical protein
MTRYSHALAGAVAAAGPSPAEIAIAVAACPRCFQAQQADWKDCGPWVQDAPMFPGWHRHLPGATFTTSSALHFDPKLMNELKADLDKLNERNRRRALAPVAGIGPPTAERQAAASLARNFGGSEAEQLEKIRAGRKGH